MANSIRTLFREKKFLSEPLKIIVPLYGTFLLFVFSVFLIFMPLLEKEMIAQKKAAIQELTQSAWSLLSEYDQQVEQGELTPEAARQKAAEQIRYMRYGPEGNGYFWIIDTAPAMVMHPFLPEMEGRDLSGFTDESGNRVFADMLETVKARESGYVNYKWPRGENRDSSAEKISFVKAFSPWQWVIGTGVYTGDVRSELKMITKGFIRVFGCILGVILLLSLYVARQAVIIEKKRTAAEKAKRLEELRIKKLLELSQMQEAAVSELTDFALAEAVHLTGSTMGYLGFLNEAGTELTIHNWSGRALTDCEIPRRTLKKSVKDSGLWGEAIRKRQPVITNDYGNSYPAGKKGLPDGHLVVTRHMTVPIPDNGRIAGIAGVANKTDAYDAADARQLQLMMDGMWKIIQRRQQEEALRQSEEQYRLLADNATDNIWIRRIPDLSLVYVSPSVEKMTGYTPAAYAKTELKQVVSEESFQLMTAILREELERDDRPDVPPDRSRTFELEQITKHGTRIWMEVKASFLRDKNGNPDRVLGISRDITRRKELEARLQQARKMEALGTLAGGIAHDFNNILSSIIGFTELARLEAEGEKAVEESLDEVMAAGLRARDLVKHILAFSRKADVQNQVMEIKPLLKECLKFLRASVPAGIEIRHNFAESGPNVVADATQLHQIFMNLFTNAAHAMKETGGILDVGMKPVQIGESGIARGKDILPGNYVEITVSDTGHGIPSDLLDRVFEPFFTTKKRGEGTGMGLSTVYGILKDLGGTISVYSEAGTGTTFRVLIPAQQNGIAGEDQTGDTPLIKGSGKILILDDEKTIVTWSEALLAKLGYEPTGFTNGPEALEKFRETPDAVDLVITDLSMPEMSGIEFAEKVRSLKPCMPILLCTGFSEGVTTDTYKASGLTGMIMKPIIARELALAVHRALTGNFREEPHGHCTDS